MQNEYVKKLTGKNPADFEFAAAHIINNSDVESFQALVEKSDFLFDFIKKNVEKRLLSKINAQNYKNLLNFLKIYSYDYENVIISSLIKFADEDLTDEMLNLLENGTDEEKAYAAKYFSGVNDTLAIDLLKQNSYSEFEPLALNCALALGVMKDESSYNLAIEKLDSEDEFEKLSAVKFLSAYNDKKAVKNIFEAMKTSSMPENIASEICYLQSFIELLQTDFKNDTLLALNHIINGLGEIIPLSQIFDFELFEGVNGANVFANEEEIDSKIAVFLLNTKQKFEQLTENDEYLFDESKEIKDEIYAIKDLLSSKDPNFWEARKKQILLELNPQSDFVFFALELVQELHLTEAIDKLKELLNSQNQTLILKTIEVIKSLGKLNEIKQDEVLNKISDANIKAVILSLFN